jgi:hypothetical protein
MPLRCNGAVPGSCAPANALHQKSAIGARSRPRSSLPLVPVLQLPQAEGKSMNWSGLVAAALLAAPAIVTAQSSASPDSKQITLHGCVRPGIDKDQVVVTDVTEKITGGQSVMPAEAHGRKVLFWLDKDAELRPHVGHMVEVTGTQGKIEKSEIELKPGRQQAGGLVVEFEGPGHDVKASNDVVGQPLGTSGRVASEKNDIPTFLVRVKVDRVQPLNETCR